MIHVLLLASDKPEISIRPSTAVKGQFHMRLSEGLSLSIDTDSLLTIMLEAQAAYRERYENE